MDPRSISPGLDPLKEAQYGFRMRLKACCKEETFFCLEKMRLVSRRRGLLIQRKMTSAADLSNEIVRGWLGEMPDQVVFTYQQMRDVAFFVCQQRVKEQSVFRECV